MKNKSWFQLKELSAGKNRLVIAYHLYKIFGPLPLRIIAFFAVSFAFLFAKERKEATNNYYKALEKFINVSKKPYSFNSFKLFLNYGNSLVDKIISFSGNFNPESFHFINEKDKTEINNLMENQKGIFFLTTHIGTSEILRTLMQSKALSKPPKINIFMYKNYCKIFNDFLSNIEIDFNTKTYSLDDIGIDTGIKLIDKLNAGEMIYMAGDRIAKTNPEKTYSVNLLNKKTSFPLGVIRLAAMLKAPTYFITCARNKKNWDIYTQKFDCTNLNRKETIEKLKQDYSKFVQDCTVCYPDQFYNFHNIFED